MSISNEPASASDPEAIENTVDEAALERVLATVPRGALAVCGIAVALVMIAWLGIYFGIFIPRGPVS